MKRIKKFWAWIRASKKRFIVALVIVLLIIFAGWKIISAKNAGRPQFQTSTVQKGTVISTISASGSVLTSNTLEINTQATGVVSKVFVQDGEYVQTGQVLAKIDLDMNGSLSNAKAYAAYISAQNSINAANNNYRSTQANLANVYDQLQGHANDETYAERAQRTQSEVSNDNAFDQTKTAHANFVSAALSLRLSSPTITAPASGKIDSVSLVEGMVLSSSTSTTSINSQKVAVIKGNSLPIVNVTVGETDISNVKVGQKVTVTFDSLPNDTFTGVVATVDKVGTVANNVTSYGINIKLEDNSDAILPNMTATANIITQTAKDALYVPSSALTTQRGKTLARTLQNGKEVAVPVETGISDEMNTVITSGLTEGEIVITGSTIGGIPEGTAPGTSVFSNTFRGVGGGSNVKVNTGAGGR